MGLLKKLVGITLVGAVLVGGWWAYNNYLAPPSYEAELQRIEQRQHYYPYPHSLELVIEQVNGTDVAFLVDTDRGLKEPVLEHFQLGNAEYRLRGLYFEGADNVLGAGRNLLEWLERSSHP